MVSQTLLCMQKAWVLSPRQEGAVTSSKLGVAFLVTPSGRQEPLNFWPEAPSAQV